MDIYHVWCNLKPGVKDLDFVASAQSYLQALKDQAQLESFRITRRKLGLGPSHFPEFHLTLEFLNLGQLDEAFSEVSARTEPLESFHHAVNSKVTDVQFALYRDFPDSRRKTGEELF